MPESVDLTQLTPMMQQYVQVKKEHKDHIVFFRLGDFYEMFFEDAKLASKELELTLTGRDCGLEERAPMCGIPHHAAEAYIARLIKKGFKVAICEQVEDPAFAKGVVSREVVRVITPGTLMENNLLQEDNNNYLCAIFRGDGGYGLAFADISTGTVHLVDLEGDEDYAVINELSRYSPSEVVFNSAFLDRTDIAKHMREKLFCTADLLEDDAFEPENARTLVLSQFQKASLEELSLEDKPRCTLALGGLISYLHFTQKVGIERLITVNVLQGNRYMNLDVGARGSLELLQTMRTREKRGSLLWVLDRTNTPMGKRLIKSYISQPLISLPEIDKRLNAVQELFDDEMWSNDLEDSLSGVLDIERLVTRIVFGSANPREYRAVAQTVERFSAIKSLMQRAKCRNLTAVYEEIDELLDLKDLMERAIVEDPPASLKDGGVIREGFHEELDRLRSLIGNTRGILGQLEASEREKTGIRSLKISYNKIFGYFLEVTKANQHLVPDYYIRKQTLANCERYITAELKELEEQIFHASEKSLQIESKLFEEVRQQTIKQLHRIQRSAAAIARLDVYLSFAKVSRNNRYVRPEVRMSDELFIEDGRHPMVELMLDGAPFVPNDTRLDNGENQIAVITGPNMAGKSTYMRQVALIVLMAQIGCFVPAKSATVGIVDGIYTRIGASDDLTAGQSTFMVEMSEVAQILRTATKQSLLILDEIGRGTSTYDGMSIARAVIEYIADPKRMGAKTLFATHYHELTEMEDQIPCVKNYNIVAKKRGEDIIFLRKVVRGGADESYGIEVSRLAGVPDWIVGRARKVLEDLESAQPVRQARINRRKETPPADVFQVTFEPPNEVQELLSRVDVNTVTPIEALTLLYQLKEKSAD